MAFTRKRITVEFSLANGSFGAGGNSARIEGHRVHAQIAVIAGPSMGQGEFAIYGLPLSMMNQLATVGTQWNEINKNKIRVFAGDDETGMPKVFDGTIAFAYADLQAQPNAVFRVSAFDGLVENMKPEDPTTKKGEADVKDTLKEIAGRMGLEFEATGIDGIKIANPYLPGTLRAQALALGRAAGLLVVIENGKLAAWKPGQSRDSGALEISPETGMVGYPAFNQQGIIVTTYFNAAARVGMKAKVTSDIKPACGEWAVHALNHALQSETPGGPWYSVIQAHRFGDTPA